MIQIKKHGNSTYQQIDYKLIGYWSDDILSLRKDKSRTENGREWGEWELKHASGGMENGFTTLQRVESWIESLEDIRDFLIAEELKQNKGDTV